MKRIKRLVDVICSSIGLLLLLPLLLGLSAAVRIFLGSPVVFRQTRPGRQAKPFVFVKFRTMTDERRPSGEFSPDAERLTRLGRFLRRTSLDELPSLWNVLRGDMSLVGPRPLLMEYVERYSDEQRRRHEVLPGITGWAQTHGRNAISWDEKLALDVWYVDNWSLWLDLRILTATVFTVVRGDGVSHANAATMPEFLGSGTTASVVTERRHRPHTWR